MHIHILGVCGTFMGGIAQLAVAMGHRVTGCDANVYPPMSTQLESTGIELIEGFSAEQVDLAPDLWVIGNAMSRGNPLVEAILERGDEYLSGPEFLSRFILQGRWVIAASGTHGKTTTSSMIAWILQYAGQQPGYLIGGVPGNFGHSAALGEGEFFVVEADEYDTAFFDKRSKFVHYRPRTLVINNLEYDHADIFPDLAAIQRQFHHLVRTVPGSGLVIYPAGEANIEHTLEMGCWSRQETLGSDSADWLARPMDESCASFEVQYAGQPVGQVEWQLIGQHNMMNGLAAIAAAGHAGIEPQVACRALAEFDGVKRRLELIGQSDHISLYDDFAHHPTAIETTLKGLRAKVGEQPILAVIEPRSNTMKQGIHRDQLSPSASLADNAYWLQPEGLGWSLGEVMGDGQFVYTGIPWLVDQVEYWVNEHSVSSPCHVVVMSNGGFGGIHQLLMERLQLQF